MAIKKEIDILNEIETRSIKKTTNIKNDVFLNTIQKISQNVNRDISYFKKIKFDENIIDNIKVVVDIFTKIYNQYEKKKVEYSIIEKKKSKKLDEIKKIREDIIDKFKIFSRKDEYLKNKLSLINKAKTEVDVVNSVEAVNNLKSEYEEKLIETGCKFDIFDKLNSLKSQYDNYYKDCETKKYDLKLSLEKRNKAFNYVKEIADDIIYIAKIIFKENKTKLKDYSFKLTKQKINKVKKEKEENVETKDNVNDNKEVKQNANDEVKIDKKDENDNNINNTEI